MKVVNRDDQTLIACRIPERAENRECDRRLIGGATFRLGTKQRRLERLSLRRRKLREGVVEHGVEKIGEARVRQVRFCFGGPRRKDGIIARFQLVQHSAPDARLPDASLPLKRNDRRERRERSERRVQFNFPSDQLARHARSIAPLRKKRYGCASEAERKWSLYGAPGLQPVATAGKSIER